MNYELYSLLQNQDLTADFITDKLAVTYRGDIKQTEGGASDLKYCYLRVLYCIEGFQDDTSLLEKRIDYATRHLNTVKETYDDLKYIQGILQKEALPLKTKNDALNTFILKNSHNKPHARMVITLYEERTVSNHHLEMMKVIDNTDVSIITSDKFSVEDKTSRNFKNMYKTLASTKSHQLLQDKYDIYQKKEDQEIWDLIHKLKNKNSIPLDIDG